MAVVDVTSGFAMIGLMGPRARDLLSSLSEDDLSNEAFPFATTCEIAIGVARVRATRITYVGELGYELMVPTEFASAVFDLVVEAGASYGLRLAGYHAMNSLRIEKAYRHWGHDISPDETPLEAGLGFCVAWDKKGGFIGREALVRQRDEGIRQRLVQFVLEEADPLLYHDEPILSERASRRADHLRHVRALSRWRGWPWLCRPWWTRIGRRNPFGAIPDRRRRPTGWGASLT